MRGLEASDLLELSQLGNALHIVDASLFMLARADPDTGWQTLAELSIGERDARLLQLRAATLGRQLELRTKCPACSETLEIEYDVINLLVPAPNQDATARASQVTLADRKFSLRRIDSHDLAAAAAETDLEAARRLLAARCLVDEDGGHPDPQALTTSELAELSERLAALDPQSDIAFALTCPKCSHGWQAPFDVAALLWRELRHCGGTLLGDIHDIARTYHWSEADILALSPRRRQAYLAMVRS